MFPFPHVTFVTAILTVGAFYIWRDHVKVMRERKDLEDLRKEREEREKGQPSHAELVTAWRGTADALRNYASESNDPILKDLVTKYDDAKAKTRLP